MQPLGKIIIFSAPSGSGKTTIVRHLLGHYPNLSFSVSACTRPRRAHEVDGRDYYFLTADDFRAGIAADAFVEWEEVYAGTYYGTLKSEIDRICNQGRHVLCDVDVHGGLRLKKYFGDRALAVFVRVPTREELESRLRRRGTETPESIDRRVAKMEEELAFEQQYDLTLVNDDLEEALRTAMRWVDRFVNNLPVTTDPLRS
ncbi:MAG: guanylate kinase [Catalinimonas sp.]